MQRFYYGMVLILVFIGLALQASLLLWIGGFINASDARLFFLSLQSLISRYGIGFFNKWSVAISL
ncbi:hypothetical protein [Shouchella lehensis]|uniref:ABC transporter permease n=1 Tax=Shouchella lehensis G1 TaxID=1246626 RepID=A0A060LU31_9BACI|nr:hypothetical protein [Shouchella lehensis]AIC93612.1 hypothetical protein BleG1_1009 [Shouchella lehensis G1]